MEIAEVIEQVLEKTERMKPDSYAVLLETDKRARAVAKELIK